MLRRKRSPNELQGPWVDPSGKKVHGLVLSTSRGPEHCEWQSAIFLEMTWPLGAKDTDGPWRQYVHNPEGLFADYAVVPLDLDAKLPAAARDTGYRHGQFELWVEGDAEEALYIVRGEEVERWPRMAERLGCA